MEKVNYKVHECEVCGEDNWSTAYEGDIRDGAFGNIIESAVVHKCLGCGVERLDEEFCENDEYYETEQYRNKLNEALTTDAFFKEHDECQIYSLETLWPISFRGKRIADIGCAAGSFLDHVSGLVKEVVAIEPCAIYHDSLKSRDYKTFSYAHDACNVYEKKIDLAVCFFVLEHVRDVNNFLVDIRKMLTDDGQLLIAVPNREDILLHLLPDEFNPFFYKVPHRWYFDKDSLEKCVTLAGFDVVETKYVHRFGIANMMHWIKDKKPSGRLPFPKMTRHMDALWQTYLEQEGLSDMLYILVKPTS